MKSVKKKTLLSQIIVVMLILSLSSISLLNLNINHLSRNISNDPINTKIVEKNGELRNSAITSRSYRNVKWLNNTDFSTGIYPWTNHSEGDTKDIEATYNSGVASYLVMGDSGKFELIVDPTNDTEMDKWGTSKKNENVIYPQIKQKTSEGFYASHIWDESGSGGGQDNFSCAVRWIRQIEMPVNMSDYKITSASIEAKFNATVEAESYNGAGGGNDDDYGGVEVPGDTTSPNQDDTWDYAYFSVEISSEDNPQMKTLLAYNKTTHLGQDNPPPNDDVPATIPDTDMTLNLEEDLLISALESALSFDDYNFTVYLGIDIFCADNWENADLDNFTSLLIRSLNLTFTYEKWIDYGESLSWTQIGDMINHTNEKYYSDITINELRMNFDYKLNETWTSRSPNSEIKILINDNAQKIYPNIKLSDFNFSKYGNNFIRAREEDYDFTNLINKEEEISLSIQVFMADNFELDHRINISIDNIDFFISYTVFYNSPSPPPADDDDDTKTETSIIEEPWFNLLIAIAAIAGATCLTGYIVYYIRVLKYPKPVRKVRKFRRTLKKKNAPEVPILGRNKAYNELYKGKLETIGPEVKRKSLKPVMMGEKSVEKIPKKMTADKVDKLISKTKK